MFNSIKLKLFVLFLVTFSIIFTGLGIFLYHELKAFILIQVDEQLLDSLHTISNPMVLEATQGQTEMELWELSHITTGVFSEKFSGHYYQIVSAKGEIVSRSPSLAQTGSDLPIVNRPDRPSYMTITGPGNVPLRAVSQSLDLPDGALLTLQVGDSMDDTYSLLRSIRNTFLLTLPIVFVLSGLMGHMITGRSLRPLNAFSAKISQITEESLNARIEEEGMVTELKPLAMNFNTMLGRIEGAFSRQRQFLSDASHELRTPTSIIKSYCDVTLNRDRTANEYREAIHKIGESVNRMCDIINRILIISRLDTKATQLNRVRMDLLHVMKDVLKLIESSAAQREIKIRLEGGSVHIRGDREGLIEAFTNILENAVKYNKPGGSVDIHVGEEDNQAIISVKDTGIGIPAEEIPKIFDRFYRVDASRGQTVGSGLGLAIVKAIIEIHGGKVEVESAVGKGSTFRVSLPK